MVKVGGKLWGGILGLMFGGPLGAIAGVFIGHQIDGNKKRTEAFVGNKEKVTKSNNDGSGGKICKRTQTRKYFQNILP